MLRSCSTRSSLICTAIGMLSISSRNSVPPLGVFELAHALAAGAGEGACLVAEQLALDQRLGQAAAIERHEMLPAARAVVVQAARHQFLAGAGLAVDQHVGRVSRPASFTVRRTCCICAERPISTDWMPCQFSSASRSARTCSAELAALDGVAHDGHQPLGAERLFDEVVGALAHGLHGHRDVAVAGDQDHRQFGIDVAQLRAATRCRSGPAGARR